MKIGTTYPSFNYDIERSFKNALGSSISLKLINNYEDLEECDLLCFPGGEDVDPRLYSKPNTHSHGVNINRDTRERFLFKHATALKKPMFGMCRGLQFISVMLGTDLIQDIYAELELSHRGGHPLEIVTESIVSRNFSNVNSLHHQGLFAEMNIPLLKRYKDRGIFITSIYNNIAESIEAERILATQFHPEFLHNSESVKFFTALGEWVEKPVFTFSEEEYNNLLRFNRVKYGSEMENQVRNDSILESLSSDTVSSTFGSRSWTSSSTYGPVAVSSEYRTEEPPTVSFEYYPDDYEPEYEDEEYEPEEEEYDEDSDN